MYFCKRKRRSRFVRRRSFLASLLIVFSLGSIAASPPIQLPKEYKQQHIGELSDYLISEKLDGVRGYWNGTHMLSRSGRIINIPKWFVAAFPRFPIDGELWIGRHQFEQVSAIVRQNQASKSQWLQVRFMVFDLPAEVTPFELRYQKALTELTNISEYLKVIPQFSIAKQPQLDEALNKVIALNGEGLMLHRKDALYQVGRSSDIVKLKPVYDAEATVLAHLPGKGKYRGMMGALKVESQQGIQFNIGSGFSDQERRNPPAVGSVITFKYYGYTQKGTPRFASFLRVRVAQ
ncbi:DNA ligase [Shewanella youngdeokensis]|uniref:DNA ligase n=1 Tax=Shewanella youngdeokensis TaxID=2999068 RepID=A0ABZ0K4B3_9GAMM|nr:DNA ligase [Shewanella sp. DAU334]